jgi:hypothetical protein
LARGRQWLGWRIDHDLQLDDPGGHDRRSHGDDRRSHGDDCGSGCNDCGSGGDHGGSCRRG